MSTMDSAQIEAEQTPARTLDETSATKAAPRHSALVRITHWVVALSFFALALSGGEIIVSHPRFYWGETGNVLTRPLFNIPIPASRRLVPTGYGYVLPDQNGWSRGLHFQSAWVLVLMGLLYVAGGTVSGHLRRDLLPARSDLSWPRLVGVITHHLRIQEAHGDHESYNVLQKVAYSLVVLILFPLVIWSGLAMSPAFDAAFPLTVNWLGGRQSARTIHLLVSLALLLFVFVHVAMVWREGFVSRMRSMITGWVPTSKERR